MANGSNQPPQVTQTQVDMFSNLNNLLQQNLETQRQIQLSQSEQAQQLGQILNLERTNNDLIDGRVSSLNSLLGVQTGMILATEKLNTLYSRVNSTIDNAQRNLGRNYTALGALTRVVGADVFNMLENVSRKNKLMSGSFKLIVNMNRDIAGMISQSRDITRRIAETSDAQEIAALQRQKDLVQLTGLVSIVSTSFSGVFSIVSGLFDISKKFFKFTFDSFEKISKIPFKMLNYASEIGSKLRQELVESIANAVEETKDFFDATSSIGENFAKLKNPIEDGNNLLLEFRDVGSDLVKTFGTGPEGLTSAIQKTQESINSLGPLANYFGGIINKNIKTMMFFEKAQKALGLSTEDFTYFANEAFISGESLADMLIHLKENTNELAKEFKLDSKIMSREFMVLRKDIINFGNLSNKELLNVTGRMNQLGIATKEAQAIFGKLNTFEDASLMAANLSQAFGITMDAYQMITESDPSKIIMDLRDSLMSTGKSFATMGRHERDLLAQYTGMSAEAMNIVFNFQNAGMSYEKLQEKLKETTPHEKQLSAIKGVTSSIRELQKIMENKSYFQIFRDGLENIINYSTKLGKVYEETSKNFEEIYLGITRLAKSSEVQGQIEGILSPFTRLLEKFKDDFSFANMKPILLKGLSITQELIGISYDNSISTLEQKTLMMRSFLNDELTISENSFSKGPLSAFSRIGKEIGNVIKLAGTAGLEIISTLLDIFNGNNKSINVGESPFAKFLGMTQPDLDTIASNFGNVINKLIKKGGVVDKAFDFLYDGLTEIVTTVADIFVTALAVGLNDFIQSSFVLRNFLPGADALKQRASFYEGRDTKGLDELKQAQYQKIFKNAYKNQEVVGLKSLGKLERILESLETTNNDNLEQKNILLAAIKKERSLSSEEIAKTIELINYEKSLNINAPGGFTQKENTAPEVISSGLGAVAFGALAYKFLAPMVISALTGTGGILATLGTLLATVFSAPFLGTLALITAAAGVVYAASDTIIGWGGDLIDWGRSWFDSSEEAAVNNNEMLKKQTAVVEENLKLQQQRSDINRTSDNQQFAVNISPANVILDNQKVGQIMFNEVTNPARGRYLDSSVIRDRSGAPTDLTPVVGNFGT